MKKWMARRALPLLLSIAMVMGMNGVPVYAAGAAAGEDGSRLEQGAGLCGHHPEHTDECGYREAQPCTHEHTEECYETVTECVHTHTEDCYPKEAETEDVLTDGDAAPSDAGMPGPDNCTHVCKSGEAGLEESGCIIKELNCTHEHDESCGAAAAQECAFVCEICNSGTSGEDDIKDGETEEPETEELEIKNPEPENIEQENTEQEDTRDTGLCGHHTEHTADCGYSEEDNTPCTHECRICPIEDLISALPDEVTEDNAKDMRAQLDEILSLYKELTEEEQDQLDLSRCHALQEALDAASVPAPLADGEIPEDAVAEVVKDGATTYVTDLPDAFVKSNERKTVRLLRDVTLTECVNVTIRITLDLNGHMITGGDKAFSVSYAGLTSGVLTIINSGTTGGIQANGNAIEVSISGTLHLNGGGTFASTGGGCGISMTGGLLSVADRYAVIEKLSVSGSGSAHFTGGTYQGTPAIQISGGSRVLSDFLDDSDGTHCAYFSGDNPIDLTILEDQTQLDGPVTVGKCTHEGVSGYAPNDDGTHMMTCRACGYTEAAEKCGYTFSGNVGTCQICGSVLTVSVSGTDGLVYDGNAKEPTVSVTLNGTTLTVGTDYTVAYSNNINVGTNTANVKVTGTTFDGTYTQTFNISKATPAIAWANTTQKVTYTGQPAAIAEPTVTLVNGETFNGTVNYSYAVSGSNSYTPGLPTNAGTYTITASIAENGNYTAATTETPLTLTINKAQGTLMVPETTFSKTFGDGGFSLDCSTNGNGKISYASDNENVAEVSADGTVLIKGAGNAVITVSLAEGTNHTGADSRTVTVTVGRAAAPSIRTETRYYTYTSGSKGPAMADVAGKLPKDRGETTYSAAIEEDSNGILSGVSVEGNGNLTYTVAEDKAEGDRATVKVTAQMANYGDAVFTLEIGLVAKKTVEPKAGSSVSVSGSNILTYGQELSGLTFAPAVFVEQGTDKEVAGTLAWKDPSAVPDAGTTGAEWVFTPADNSEYTELTGTAAVIVAKATPDITAPVADAVTYDPSGRLGSVALSGGSATWTVGGRTVDVKGTWSWKDGSVPPAAGNSGYTAVFTPNDTQNYDTVERTVAVAVDKAVPYIAVPPAAARITYGDALDASALIGGTVQYSGSDSTPVAGSFAWKDGSIKPAVSDSGCTEYAVVFTPADSTDYSSVETKVTLTVEQAENAPDRPSDTMDVPRRCEKVSDVELPAGWQWQEEDRDTALEIGKPVTAAAVYTGADKDNYKNTTVNVAITRADCDHETTEIRNAAAATCQEKGYSGDTYCLDCGRLLAKGNETPMADHSGGTAICIKGRICEVCGTEYTAKDSSNHMRTEIRGRREAACTADGYTGDRFCTDCGAKTGPGTAIPATGHDWHVTSVEEATTASKGKRIYTCSNCGLTREEAIPKLPQPSHTHDYIGRETKAAACTETGVITYSCSCGDSYTQDTAALGHDYRSSVTKEPTTKEAGVRTYICTRCGSAYAESIPKLPEETHTHRYQSRVTKKAACTEAGARIFTCSCGDGYTKTISALGHDYRCGVTEEPTTKKAGVRTYICTRCGKTYTESIPKLPEEDHEHDYSITVVKGAACTEAGVKRYACACGDSYTESIPAPGHSYHSRVTQEPTVSAEGVMAYICRRCGDTYTKPIDRLKDTSSGPGDRPEPGKPFIKEEPGKEGWKVIKEETDKAEDESAITVDMNGSAVVPGDVLENIRGRDIAIGFDMGNGITWSVNGMSVQEGEIGDIDLSVQTDTEMIPVDIVNNIAGESYSIQISLAHEGEFGFTAVLSIDLGKENAGLTASLYHYNEVSGELELVSTSVIAEDGTAALTFTHASDYAIVVEEETGGEDVASEPTGSTGTDAGDKGPQTGQPWRAWWIMVVGALVIIIGIGVFFLVRKKKGGMTDGI